MAAQVAKLEAEDAKAADKHHDLQNAVTLIEEEYVAADIILTDGLAAEIKRAEFVEAANALAISNETARAQAAEAANALAISNEESARIAAKAELSEAIAIETDRAQAAEAALTQDVADILSNTDITAIDSFTEVIAATNLALAAQSSNHMIIQQGTLDVEANTFTPNSPITTNTEQIFVNGLLQAPTSDYIEFAGSFTFVNEAVELVAAGASVAVYGVNAVRGSIAGTSEDAKRVLFDSSARVADGTSDFITVYDVDGVMPSKGE